MSLIRPFPVSPTRPPRWRVTLPGLLLLLSGCTMMPKYERPAAPVTGKFPRGSDHSADAADIGWRDFFTDPRLKRYIEIALENNRDLRVATLQVEQARAQYRIQSADLFPSLEADGGYTRSRSAGNTSNKKNGSSTTTPRASTKKGTGTSGTGGTTVPVVTTSSSALNQATGSSNGSTANFFSASLASTAYEVDLFGRVRSLNRQALEQYFATDEARRSAQIALVAQVAAQYLTLREQEEQVRLADETLIAVKKSYDLTKSSFDAGASSELDLRSADAQVQTAKINLYTFQRQSAQAANYLSLLIGSPLPADLPPGRSLQNQGIMANIPSGLPSDLLERRPDILEAEHTLLAANANIGAARAAFFPKITLTGSAGTTSVEFGNLFSKASEVWSFSPQISIPIFEGGRNLAELDVAQVSKRIEVANYEKAIQSAFREVADALVARDSDQLQLNAQEALVASLQKRYELADVRYREGLDSYLDALTAQQDLYNAQQNLITARATRLTNLITLYKALGGGFK